MLKMKNRSVIYISFYCITFIDTTFCMMEHEFLIHHFQPPDIPLMIMMILRYGCRSLLQSMYMKHCVKLKAKSASVLYI